MANTKSIGDTSEAVVLAEFVKAGFPVLLPFGDNQRYDMVVEAYGRLLRVQCKTARPVHGGAVLCFKAYSGAFGPGDRSPNRRRSYRSEADLFAAYAPSTGQVYVLAVDEVPETDVWLRLTPTLSRQQRRIRWAKDHTLAAWAGAAVKAPISADPGRLTQRAWQRPPQPLRITLVAPNPHPRGTLGQAWPTDPGGVSLTPARRLPPCP